MSQMTNVQRKALIVWAIALWSVFSACVTYFYWPTTPNHVDDRLLGLMMLWFAPLVMLFLFHGARVNISHSLEKRRMAQDESRRT